MPHHDASTFTVNIALNRVGEDYEVSEGLRVREEPGSSEQNPVVMTKSPRAQREMVLGMRGGLPGRVNQGIAWQVEASSQEPRHRLRKVRAVFLHPPSFLRSPVSCNRCLHLCFLLSS